MALVSVLTGCDKKESPGIEAARQSGRAAFEADNFNEAINIFREALKKKPSDRDFLYYLGLSFRKLDLLDSSLIYFRRAKILYDHDREVNRQLLELCPIVGDYECALNAIAALITTGDNERMHWPALAELYYRTKDLYMAAKYCRLILAGDSGKADYYIYLSSALAQMGKFDESNEVLYKSIDRLGPTPEGYSNIAVNFISMNQLDSAESALRKSLALNPGNVPVWINLAHVLSGQGSRAKKEEALEIYRNYYSQTPKFYNLDSVISALEAELQ
jgi:tetratricopeptide (TPR) repeat protein